MIKNSSLNSLESDILYVKQPSGDRAHHGTKLEKFRTGRNYPVHPSWNLLPYHPYRLRNPTLKQSTPTQVIQLSLMVMRVGSDKSPQPERSQSTAQFFQYPCSEARLYHKQCVKAERDSPQSPVPSIFSSISTPPIAISTMEMWGNFSDVGKFYSDDEPQRIGMLSSRSPPPSPARKQKRKLTFGKPFKKDGDCRIRLRSLWVNVA